jgi:hypothetical protein
LFGLFGSFGLFGLFGLFGSFGLFGAASGRIPNSEFKIQDSKLWQ